MAVRVARVRAMCGERPVTMEWWGCAQPVTQARMLLKDDSAKKLQPAAQALPPHGASFGWVGRGKEH